MMSRKLIPIVTAIPIPTKAAGSAARSTMTGKPRAGRAGGRSTVAHGVRVTCSPHDRQRRSARVDSSAPELLLDPEEAVVLRYALRARRCSRLDLPRAHRDDEVGDRRVLGLARAVADHRR